MERATEVDYNHWIYSHRNGSGPMCESERDDMKRRFVEETGFSLPEGIEPPRTCIRARGCAEVTENS